MKRFTFLALALSTLFAPLLRAADASPVYELRIYTCNEGKLDALLSRFRDHTCKLFEKHGMKNIGYWVPVDEENGSKTTLIYVLEHKSRDAAKESFKAFGADPDWQAARKASEEAGKILAKPPESIFMTTTDYSPPVAVAKASKPRVFELRTYTTKDGKLDALHSRFRDHTMKLFTKHGMTNLAYWTPTDIDKGAAKKLIYILAHDSKEAGLASFAAFRADPDWVKAKTASETANGGSLTIEPLTEGVKSIYMKPTDFSPIQ
ncbi:NIPSNAP family protein [Prosthecobacter sp.]|uniref:NIPSNAP family protein n=1 Tax=Prosthecobacter sp. TaxID=1965333 RepID=UPI003784EAC6